MLNFFKLQSFTTTTTSLVVICCLFVCLLNLKPTSAQQMDDMTKNLKKGMDDMSGMMISMTGDVNGCSKKVESCNDKEVKLVNGKSTEGWTEKICCALKKQVDCVAEKIKNDAQCNQGVVKFGVDTTSKIFDENCAAYKGSCKSGASGLASAITTGTLLLLFFLSSVFFG